ncbi:MAG: hypothetical protein LQ340_007098 [Diploschistes diacapsis]|nr:MAG: hypothetical protein LQ340_007098 [Diploschistes diacapsis]
MADVLGLASAVAGLVSVAIEVSRISFEYASEVRHASKAVSDYLRELSALTSAVLRLQEVTAKSEVQKALDDAPSQVGPLLQCMDDMTKLRAKLGKYTGSGLRTKIKSLLWPFEETETRKQAEMLRRYCGLLELMMSADTLAVSSKVLHEVRSMKVNDRRKEILAWLSTDSYKEKQADIFGSYCAGTARWVLETPQYCSWLKGEQDVLWCFGNRMFLVHFPAAALEEPCFKLPAIIGRLGFRLYVHRSPISDAQASPSTRRWLL